MGVEEVAEEGDGVRESGDEISGKGVGGAVELEAGEDVESETLAMGSEEMLGLDLGLGLSPFEEVEDGAFVRLGVEEKVRGCLGSEVGREGWEHLRVAFKVCDCFIGNENIVGRCDCRKPTLIVRFHCGRGGGGGGGCYNSGGAGRDQGGGDCAIVEKCFYVLF